MDNQLKKEWVWDQDGDNKTGVIFENGELTWYTDLWGGGKEMGNACCQTLEKFVQDGPIDDTIPDEYLAELCQELGIVPPVEKRPKVVSVYEPGSWNKMEEAIAKLKKP